MTINDLDKDQLADYAKQQFNVHLDMRKRLSDLQAIVRRLEQRKQPEVVTEQAAKAKPAYLLNTQTGLHFLYTDTLATYLGEIAVPCDADGRPL